MASLAMIWWLVACGGGDSETGDDADADADTDTDTDTDTDSGTGTGTSTDTSTDTGTRGRGCDDPDPNWLLCEDFERGGGDWDAWADGSAFLDSPGFDDRGRVTLSADDPHGGAWAAHMPHAASSGYEGASLDWYACDGAPATNCPLRSFDTLYFRVFVRFAEDHRLVHHFLSIGGSQPDDFWYHGTAGCLPNGELDMGTTVDFHEGNHESFFYTYHPDMACDVECQRYADEDAICQGCLDRGLPTCTEQGQCCWGENLEPDPPVPLPVGPWVCLEMAMSANTPGEPDGSIEYWVDGASGHRVEGLLFRTSPTLALNRARIQHYVTTEDAAGHSNRVWFDDAVVSTEPIGCD